MAPDGFGATKLTESTANDNQPAWSAEGTQIAFASQRDDADGTSDPDIYRMNAAGNGERQLTTEPAFDLKPSWFPDETRIVFRRNALTGTDAHIWILTLNENGQPVGEQQLTDGPTSNIMPAVSPNGKLIAFASNRDGDFEIYVMKVAPESATNVPKKLTKNTSNDWNPDWSPSGKKIAFERFNPPGSSRDIFRMRADGTRMSNLTESTAIDANPSWPPMP